MIKRYSELVKLKTFNERLDYLKLNGIVSDLTFGHNRYLNQQFYASKEWKDFRRHIIIRDNGCDLACPDREIYKKSKIIVHHLNPITAEDILDRRSCVLDEENAVCTILKTHNMIHYGIVEDVPEIVLNREKDDTTLWR